MIKIESLDSVIVDEQPAQDLISAIANNLQGDLAGIIAALKEWDADRIKSAKSDATEAERKQYKLQTEQLQKEITDRDVKILELQYQLSPDIAALLPALLAAGLESWAESAITSANPEHGVFPMVRRLESIAACPPYWSQCQEIKDLFGTICTLSGVYPTSDQASAMQLVLDAGSSSTGPVAADHLNFHPWIKQG